MLILRNSALPRYTSTSIKESIIESTEKNIIGNKRSTHVNRLSDNCFVVVIVPIQFGNYISNPTSIHYASDSEFEVAIFRIGFGDSPTFRYSTAKNNFLSFSKFDCSRNLSRANFAEVIFPLLKY